MIWKVFESNIVTGVLLKCYAVGFLRGKIKRFFMLHIEFCCILRSSFPSLIKPVGYWQTMHQCQKMSQRSFGRRFDIPNDLRRQCCEAEPAARGRSPSAYTLDNASEACIKCTCCYDDTFKMSCNLVQFNYWRIA